MYARPLRRTEDHHRRSESEVSIRVSPTTDERLIRLDRHTIDVHGADGDDAELSAGRLVDRSYGRIAADGGSEHLDTDSFQRHERGYGRPTLHDASLRDATIVRIRPPVGITRAQVRIDRGIPCELMSALAEMVSETDHTTILAEELTTIIDTSDGSDPRIDGTRHDVGILRDRPEGSIGMESFIKSETIVDTLNEGVSGTARSGEWWCGKMKHRR